MHTELIKHNLKEDGEDNIFDTAGMAICLGVVQNYTFEQAAPKSPWKLVRKETPDEDALYGGFAGGGDDAASAQMVEGLLLTKKACMDFAEELQVEISEVMYARVHEASGEEIADEFCSQAVKPVKKERTQKYVPAASPMERQKHDPSALMADMLKTRDTSGAISEMLETEASFPERMLDAPLQAVIGQAVEQVECQVCKVAVRQAHARVKEVEKTPAFKDRWQRQSLVAEAVNFICHGKDHAKLQAGFYPTVPGNPPEWAQAYHILKQEGRFKLRKGKLSIAQMKTLAEQPRKSGAKSDDDEGEGEEEREEEEDWERSRAKHEYEVMKQAIIRTACKQAIDQRLDTDDGDLSELLLEKRGEDAKVAARAYCAPVCAAGKTGPDEL